MAPLFLGIDMHTLSAPALSASLEVVAANGVEVMIVEIDEYASTPAVSDAILTYNPPHGRPAKCKEDSIREDCSRLHNAPARLSRSVHKRSRQSGRHECHSCCGDQHGRESARRRGLASPPNYYLFQHRPNWRESAAVGFKWFVDGLLDGSLCFGGEESGGASFARLDSSVWTTYKDGIVPALLSAESR